MDKLESVSLIIQNTDHLNSIFLSLCKLLELSQLWETHPIWNERRLALRKKWANKKTNLRVNCIDDHPNNKEKFIPFLRSLEASPLLQLESIELGQRSSGVHQMLLRIQSCMSIRAILEYSKTNKDMTELQLSKICTKILALQHTSNQTQNYSQIVQIIENMNLHSCDLDTFSDIVSILPLTFAAESFNSQTIISIFSRIESLINEQLKTLSVTHLINFFSFSTALQDMALSSKISSLLCERLCELKYKNTYYYLQAVSKSRLPSVGEKQLFSKFMNKMSNEVHEIEVRSLVSYYKFLKSINYRVYKCQNPLPQIESLILNRIHELQQKEVFHLLNFKTNDKTFSKLIYHKLIDSINLDGESLIDPVVVLSLVGTISQSHGFVLSANHAEKFVLFLKKNITKGELIRKLVHNSFLSTKHLQQLSHFVCQLEPFERQKYHNSQYYLYELCRHGVVDQQIYKQFLEGAIENNKSSNFNQKFIISAIIVNKLWFKNSQIPQLKQAHDYFVETIKQLPNSALWFSPFLMQRPEIIDQFNKGYNNPLYHNAVQNVMKGQKLKMPIFELALYNSDMVSLQKLLKEDRIPLFYFRILINRVNHNPEAFKGHFDKINKLLIELVQKQVMLKQIYSYLCNQEVHWNVDQFQAKLFVSLALSVVESFKFSVIDFATYFIESPSKYTKGCSEYQKLLQGISANLLKKNFESQNFKSLFSLSILAQLITINSLPYDYAKIALTHNHLSSSHSFQNSFSYYCKLLTMKSIKQNFVPIKSTNIFIFARFPELLQEMPQSQFQIVKAAVNQSKFYEIQESLINLRMNKKIQNSLILGRILLQKYNENLKSIRFQLYHVLNNLKKEGKGIKGYDQLLSRTVQLCKEGTFSFDGYVLLLRECIQRKHQKAIEASEIVIKFFVHHPKCIKNIVPLLNQLMSVNSSATLQLFHKRNNSYFLKYLTPLFDLLDVSDERTIKSLAIILNNNLKQKPVLNSGIFQFLRWKRPKLEQLKDKIELTSKSNQNIWFLEALVSFLDANTVKYQIYKLHGYKILEIEGKYFTFLDKRSTPQSFARMKEFIVFLLSTLGIKGVNEDLVKVYFIGKQFNKRDLSFTVISQICQLFGKHNQFYLKIKQSIENDGRNLIRQKRR